MILLLSTGCYSFPKSSGSWTGTVDHVTLYVGEKEFEAAVLKVSSGSPAVGKQVYLLDQYNRTIDASSFPSGATVTVSGISGFEMVKDGNGGLTTPVKGTQGLENPSIEIEKITLAGGEKVNPRLAVAPPTTQPTTMP